MKLTLKIKLLPSDEQAKFLLETIKEANAACNSISDTAWDKRCFQQFKLHNECYYSIKSSFNLKSQAIVRCISKVADAYRVDKKTKRVFKPLGGIAYDRKILTYKANDVISLWSINGRLKIPFVCHNDNYLPFIKGEADLIYKKGKFFLFQTVDITDTDIEDIEEFIGIDFGLADIAVTSDGINHSANWLNTYRAKKQAVRSSVQSKGTRSSKRLLKRLTGREKTTATIINHTISKQIVKTAKETGKGISIEDLTGIRFTSKRRNKTFRTKLGKWNFYQLRSFLSYKSLLSGVKMVIVNPRYTSKTCNVCKYIGDRTNKVFKCINDKCKIDKLDADFNAAQNISLLGQIINLPERCDMYSCSIHC